MNRKTSTIAAAAIAVLLALPAAAGAHVTLQPETAPAGGFTRLDVRVPNEEESAATTKVVVQLPAGFDAPSYEPVAGWRISTAKDSVTFTATGDGIEPGEFQDFGLSVAVPDGKVGSKLTFKALQTYEGGDVVRWIGAPGSDRPAPQVTLVAAESADTGHEAAPATPAAATASDDDDDEDDEDDEGTTLPIIALIVGGLGLLAGGAALVRSRG
ncbi:MAG TPA: YcnI family protein [Solirubrobacteraceae bacterium]|nr:YcnI family protein [Solirubrobacteraceae bacterium]